MKNVVTWFEIPVTNMQRAKAFYSAVMETNLYIGQLSGEIICTEALLARAVFIGSQSIGSAC